MIKISYVDLYCYLLEVLEATTKEINGAQAKLLVVLVAES
jgi:hypothetical protein